MKNILCVIALVIANIGFGQSLINFNGYQYVEVDGVWKFKDQSCGLYYNVSDEHISLKFSTAHLPTIVAFEAANGLRIVHRSPTGWNAYGIITSPESIFTYAGNLLADENVEALEIGTFGEYHGAPPVNPPNDLSYSDQWYMENANDNDIDMLDAWDIATGSNQVTVGVIDGGLHWDINDLGVGTDGYENIHKNPFESIWVNPVDPTTYTASDPDGNGKIGDWKGWHFYDFAPLWPNQNDTRTTNPHGTRVASIIAAKTGNGTGMAGVAGGWSNEGVRIVGAIINNENSNSQYYNRPVSTLLGPAIDYCVAQNAKLINISVGIGYTADAYASIQLAYDAGVTIVCSSGNDPVLTAVAFPGNHYRTIAVGATNQQDVRWVEANRQSGYGVELDFVAPGVDITSMDHTGTVGQYSGTSFSAPIVTGIVALMLSENPCLSPTQVRQILRSTCEKVNPNLYNYNYDYQVPGKSEELGYGRVNAYQAVLGAQNMNHLNFDLYARDHYLDYGADACYPFTWDYDESPDIWVRNQDDGETIQEHEDYLNFYNSGGTAATKYVYVRVSNAGCNASTGNEILELNTTAAMTSGNWPNGWTNFNGGGQYIGSAPIPIVPAGGSQIVKVPWDLMYNISSCILARITNETNDPIGPLPADLSLPVYNQNNIALRNVIIYNMGPLVPYPIFDKDIMPHGHEVSFTNSGTVAELFDFSFISEANALGHHLNDDAEVTMRFNDESWDLFSEVVADRSDIRITGPKSIQFLASQVDLDDIELDAGVTYQAFIGYSFLTQQINEEDEYEINFVQKYSALDPIVGDHWTGGLHYKVRRNDRATFLADAGADQTITIGETAILEAADINEPAAYNWSILGKRSFESGLEVEVSPTNTTTYELEVIATADGFKDYDEVTVNVYEYVIQSVSPNPASTTITVDYLAATAANAQLDIIGLNSNDFMTHTLDTTLSSSTFDISQLSTGIYSVILICDGVLVDVVQLSVL
ncbi:MAG: hypothetical protein ACJAUD_000054 [Crocinitomicaceae bacterium]|jgi:hypothetical protein